MAGPGRDGEAGAAERRLAEALRAQASLGGRPTAAAPAKPVVRKPTPPNRGTPKGGGQRDGRKPARAGSPGGQSGPHGRGVSSGHQSGPQRAASRPPGAPLPPAGRGSGGGPHRPGDDQLPTTKVVTADPGAAGASTTVAPSAQPGPVHPLSARSAAGATKPPARAFLLDPRLRMALLVGLLAGVLLGCALALLSVLDPGLLPAIA